MDGKDIRDDNSTSSQLVTVPRLEGCTILHCAALSGSPTMCRIVSRIWEEVQFKVAHDSRVQQNFDRMINIKPRLATFYDEIKYDVRPIPL